jgi:hypothetical protein
VLENNVWRLRYNEELSSLFKGEEIVWFIKSQRIIWLGHVERLEDNAMQKRMLKGRLYSKRRKGRPRMRWFDNVIWRKWRWKVGKRRWGIREQWRLVVEEAKALTLEFTSIGSCHILQSW